MTAAVVEEEATLGGNTVDVPELDHMGWNLLLLAVAEPAPVGLTSNIMADLVTMPVVDAPVAATATHSEPFAAA